MLAAVSKCRSSWINRRKYRVKQWGLHEKKKKKKSIGKIFVHIYMNQILVDTYTRISTCYMHEELKEHVTISIISR